MNKTILENRRVQILAAAVCLLLFGCQGSRTSETKTLATNSYSTGYVQNDTNAIDANETNEDTTTDEDNQNNNNNSSNGLLHGISAKLAVQIASVLPGTPMKSCKVSDLDLKWPLQGKQSIDWAISQYYDLNFASSLLDYVGNVGDDAKTFDNHKGTDIALASFRQMDVGKNVYAAAAGKVVAIQSSGFDRSYGPLQPGCDSNTNYVTIQHDNGFTTNYFHLKKFSIIVNVGQQVAQGQKLGQVGSSGCSTHPHLHLEVRNCNKEPIDPFENDMWLNSDAPVYDAPKTYMDVYVKEGAFSSAQVIDPPANITTIKKNKVLGVGFTFAGAEKNDQLKVRLIRPNGTPHHTWTKKYTKQGTLSVWAFSKQLNGSTGTWLLQFYINNTLKQTYLLNVTN